MRLAAWWHRHVTHAFGLNGATAERLDVDGHELMGSRCVKCGVYGQTWHSAACPCGQWSAKTSQGTFDVHPLMTDFWMEWQQADRALGRKRAQ